MPFAVVVVMTVPYDEPDEATEFVRQQLTARLGEGEPAWQTDKPHLLPRWQISGVRREVQRNEHGGPAG